MPHFSSVSDARQLAQSFVELDHDSQLVVERGQQAWKSLRSDETFEKWVAIGRAIEIGRNFVSVGRPARVTFNISPLGRRP